MTQWLLAGAGQAGRCHIAAIERVADAHLVGVVDPSPPKNFPGPVFSDLPTAISSTNADAVVVASPNDTHVSLISQAVKDRLPVLCEKPVGRSSQDAIKCLTMAEEKNVSLGVVLNQRGQRHNRWVKEKILSRALEPVSIKFTGSIRRLSGWHTDPARSGGGILRTIVLHYLDLLVWWLGSFEVEDVVLQGAPVEDAVSLSGRAGEGCSVKIEIEATNDAAFGPVLCIINGDGCRIRMDGHVITDVSGLVAPPKAETWDPELPFGPGHVTAIEEATRSLTQGDPLPVPLREFIPLLEDVEAMRF